MAPRTAGIDRNEEITSLSPYVYYTLDVPMLMPMTYVPETDTSFCYVCHGY